jgi:hypothetical protein
MGRSVSKTQDKKQTRVDEAAAFVAERRKIQLAMLEQNYEMGVKLFLDQKENLSFEEVENIEAMMVEQRKSLDALHEQANTRA